MSRGTIKVQDEDGKMNPKSHNLGQMMDNVSLVVFPLFSAIFNFIFWWDFFLVFRETCDGAFIFRVVSKTS